MIQFKPYPRNDGIYVMESFGNFVVPTFLATYYNEMIKICPAVKDLFDPKFHSVSIFEGWRNSLFTKYPDVVIYDSVAKDTTPYTIECSERVQVTCKGNPIMILPSMDETIDEIEYLMESPADYNELPYFCNWLRMMVTERFFYAKMY